MLEIDYSWASTGSSGGGTNLKAVRLDHGARHSALYVTASTLASTQSVSFQTSGGPSSNGPWATENSTAIAATGSAGAAAVIRVTGPYKWMRPVLNSASTGTYALRLIAVS